MDTRPMRADARRNYERLITTARVAFMENGTGASLDDIAKRAGVGSGTLYRHFPTRDALLHAVLRERIDGLLAHAEELLADPDPDAALGLWLRTYLSGAATPRGTSTVIIEAMSAEWADTGLGAAAAAICEALGRLLDRAQRAGSIRADIDPGDLLRLTNAIGVASERTPDREAYAARMLALLFDGLRTG
ncbi:MULTISPECIES: TetR/AcrR family transcriptional regulator [Actinomadura]|uniref:DNA-binding transcriptional regulator, AcrR family n=1 Tax=Actinomadura madurae TaxID=1993 RepID=A0A1I4WAE6_9ACTN|nr:TetR/AcrR family transcriptional regulator [Actinomadura madurae]URN02147.1 TetR/AcrR family transcriptional regulator [Actinomadura madurae]SFN10272.1 DNA-binding transcriptional regulator, AcrR family [Actinomadura madurae]SPT64466.1 HTH-type transcriptional repressor KstR2 [Actinomadura madurae]